MIWQIKLVIVVVLMLGSNFLTYKYMDNSCNVAKLESIEEAHEKSRLLSRQEAALAKIIVKEKQQLEQQAKQDEPKLRNETKALDPACKLSDDGLRVLRDAINRANSAGSN